MNKRKADEALVEEIIRDLTDPEDNEMVLQISACGKGKIWVSDYNGRYHGYGETLKKALLAYARDKGVTWMELDYGVQEK
jgi:hypothetical protein